MNKIRALCMWLLLLTKRLYKKPAFLGILIMIPVVVFAYGLTAQEESGMITIVLSAESAEDPLSRSLILDLENSSEVIRFISDKDPVSAEEMVYNGVADAAWIISSTIEEDLRSFVSGRYTGRGFVRVVIREETVPLLLSNEKLAGKLFIRSAKTCFIEYLRSNESVLSDISDEQIGQYFDGYSFENDLFSYSYIEDNSRSTNASNYLLMPVRGILAILVLIGAMAAAMFYISDDHEGLFSWISLRRKPFVELGYQIIAVSNVMLVAFLSLIISNIHVNVFREILAAFMYVICCSVFGQLIRLLCRNRQAIGMVMPILTMAMLVICPVFVSLPGLEFIQLLLPPTYYLNAVYNVAYLGYMLLYTALLWVAYNIGTMIYKRA